MCYFFTWVGHNFLHLLIYCGGWRTCGSQGDWGGWVLSFHCMSSCVYQICQTQVIRLGGHSCLYLLNYLAGLLDFNSINNIDLEKSTSHRVLRMLAVQRFETLTWAHWDALSGKVLVFLLCYLSYRTEQWQHRATACGTCEENSSIQELKSKCGP